MKCVYKILNEYTNKELLILEQYKNGPYYTLVTYLTENEHLQFINKLIKSKNLYCIIFLACIYTEYNQKFLIDYFIKYKDASILADFLDACNDFWKELDQKYIVNSILALNDKKYVKDLLETKWLFFLTNNIERKKLEDFIK